MSAVIIENVSVADLPAPQAARVTVRIESEAPAVTATAENAAGFVSSDPAFGI